MIARQFYTYLHYRGPTRDHVTSDRRDTPINTPLRYLLISFVLSKSRAMSTCYFTAFNLSFPTTQTVQMRNSREVSLGVVENKQ